MNYKTMVKEQEQSGLSITEYCKQKGIRANTFYNWRSKLKEPEPKFLKVETKSRVTLELEGGVKLKVSVEDLKAVLAALR